MKKHFYRNHREFLHLGRTRTMDGQPVVCNNDDEESQMDVNENHVESAAAQEATDALVLPASVPVTREHVLESLASNIVEFFLTARDLHSLPTSTAANLSQMVLSIVHEFGRNFGQLCQSAASNESVDLDALFELSLDKLLSDSKIHQILCNHYDFVQPVEHAFENSHHKLYYVPVGEVLSLLVNHANVRSLFFSHKDRSPFFSSPYFLEKIAPYADKENAIYLAMYSDEFEVANPIGAAKKRHKLVAVYFKVLNFPPSLNSCVENAFLVCLGKQALMDEIGIGAFFEPLVAELNSLYYDGLRLESGERISVLVAFMTGDNLSVHGMMGIRRCFSSGSICRFCEISFSDLAEYELAEEEPRNHVSYHSESTNVEGGRSPFADLPYASFPYFFPPDWMHDILEGVSHVVLSIVLSSLLKEKLSDLDELNSQLAAFPFPFKLATFTRSHIAKMHFPLTASQMLEVMKHFPLIFGNLAASEPVPEFWELLLLHQEIILRLLAPSYQGVIDIWRFLVHRHNELVYSLCSNKPKAKCKLHYLSHYPHLINYYNGLKHSWTMRFESRHQYFKNIARVVGQFRNIAFTCANRFQMRMCVLLRQRNMLPSLVPNQVVNTTVGNLMNYEELEAVSHHFGDDSLQFSEPCVWAQELSLSYKITAKSNKRTALIWGIDEHELDPIFCVIEKIVCIKSQWMAVCSHMLSYFSPHFGAYVLHHKQPNARIISLAGDLLFPPLPVHTVRCTQCVVVPYSPL